MRLRNIQGADDAIEESNYVIKSEQNNKGKWKSLFNNNNELYIEIGMGKGKFIIEQAVKNPDINYIGIEKYSSVLLRAIQKIEDLDIKNLLFIKMNAENIENVFEKNEVNKIYLNFSDPWPKDRHSKRRLTSKEYLARYDNVLNKDGNIEFKTDNQKLFDFSLEEIENTKWKLDYCTRDLHSDKIMMRDNIMTEYEEKFSIKGNKIYKLITSR